MIKEQELKLKQKDIMLYFLSSSDKKYWQKAAKPSSFKLPRYRDTFSCCLNMATLA